MLLAKCFVYLIIFASGILIASAFISFINSIGILRQYIIKTQTAKYITLYKVAIISSLIAGSTISYYLDFTFNLKLVGEVIAAVIGLFYGVFIGYVVMALTEVFDVMPVWNNKVGFKINLMLTVLAVAIGKMIGSLVYWMIPGFYS